jgi:PKD repeat protein
MGYVFFDGSSSYDSDGEIVLYEWDYGDGNTYNSSYDLSDNQYCNEGTYNVTLTVTDNDGLTGNLTKSVDIVLANLPPPNVEIDGPDSGNAGTEYEFRFKVFIFYDAPFYIKVDWGDGNNTVWINVLPYYYVDLSHKWSKEGKYTIRAKAKDLCREGQWTEFEVRVTRDKTIASSVLLKFLEQFPLLQSLFMHLGLQ